MILRNVLRFAALATLGAGCIFAGSISSVIVYGDSLSDNGNLYAAVGQPGPPYYNGRVSNGPVAVEQLASALNVPLVDFAFAGATTGVGNTLDGGSTTSLGIDHLPGMLTEFNSVPSQATIPANPNGLYIVWGGPNDFSSLPSNATQAQIAAAINGSVADLLTIVNGLRSQGITDILVPGMPDLGLTPEYLSEGKVASEEATALTTLFNETLVSQLPAGTKYFNTQGLLETIVSDPSAYGFTNVTQACFTGTSLCSDPNSYLFFDSEHPTTYADSIVAKDFLSVVTPEPASVLLAVFGLGGLFVTRKAISTEPRA